MQTEAQADFCRLLNSLVALAANKPQAEKISASLECQFMAYAIPEVDVEWQLKFGLTKLESRMAERLHASFGKSVNRDAVMNACYFDTMDQPHPRILDIFVCRMRKKLAGSPFKIETVRGVGWRMIRRQSEKLAA